MKFKKIMNKLNFIKEWFALLGVVGQLSVVMVFGFGFVLISGLLVGSVESSYLIFVDPPALASAQREPFVLLYSFLLMLFGLVVTGFIISVLSSSLENTFRDIRKGRLKYFGENHTLIVNYNHKIIKILQEMNLLYQDNKSLHEVIIFIDNDEDIEKLQLQIEKLNFTHLHIYIRYGDVLSWQRYEELSIYSVHSIIILSDDSKKDPFIRDNINLRITNLLFCNDEFANYLRERKRVYKQIKAVVEFTDDSHFDTIVSKSTESLFLALAPTKVLSSILNLSMINLDFYTTWSELLSFEDYELYFIEAKKYNLCEDRYKDVLLRHKHGLLLGISRVVNGEFRLLLNAQEETIQEFDWLIFISEDIHTISFLDQAQEYKPKLYIQQPKETFIRDVAIIGQKREIEPNELLDMDKSNIIRITFDTQELFEKSSFEKLLYSNNDNPIAYDTIIINLDDELVYRVALSLKFMFSQDDIKKFVFLVDDALIAEHLEKAGFENTILSELLVSKYIAQVSNQLSLHKVFNILFVKEGPEINFIDAKELPSDLIELKHELIHNNMLYLGVINKDGSVKFESKDLSDAKKIIVFSDGEE